MCVIARTIFKPFQNGTDLMANETKTTEQTIREELTRLDWMIPDAKRDLMKAAEAMARRAVNAVKECEAMMAEEPCSLGWVDFAGGDVRDACEAKAKLNSLYERQRLLKYLLGENE